MPRYLPSVAASWVGSTNIGNMRGGIAEPRLELGPVEAFGVGALDVGGAEGLGIVLALSIVPLEPALRSFRRSKLELTKVPRLMRWVRLGAAPLYTWVWGWATICSPSASIRPVHLVAAGAQARELRLPALDGLVVGRARALVFCCSTQRSKSAERQGDHPHPHVGVGQPAELGALPPVLTGLVGLQVPGVDPAGHRVPLAVQLGDPERVDDVAGGDVEPDLLAGRDHHLVGRDERKAVVTGDRRVVELPPPLLPGDVDDQRILRFGVDVEEHA